MKVPKVFCEINCKRQCRPAHKGYKEFVMGGGDRFRTLQACFSSAARMTSQVNDVGLNCPIRNRGILKIIWKMVTHNKEILAPAAVTFRWAVTTDKVRQKSTSSRAAITRQEPMAWSDLPPFLFLFPVRITTQASPSAFIRESHDSPLLGTENSKNFRLCLLHNLGFQWHHNA